MSDNDSDQETMDHSGYPTQSNGDLSTQNRELNEKQLRKKYRSFRDQLINNRLECVDPSSNLIETILENVNRTYGSGNIINMLSSECSKFQRLF
jgi:hypothetical protein